MRALKFQTFKVCLSTGFNVLISSKVVGNYNKVREEWGETRTKIPDGAATQVRPFPPIQWQYKFRT